MELALVLYFIPLLALGWQAGGQINRAPGGDAFRECLVAGGRQTAPWVTASLLASMVGGSATFGSLDLAAKVGFPAFWWLGVGSLGLLLQAWLLSAKVRDLGAATLPHVAAITMGPAAGRAIALVICVSWVGVVAGQFAALFQFTALVAGFDSGAARFLLAAAVILYTASGGQLSVIRTDFLQFALIALGLGLTCACLPGLWPGHVELLNDRFGGADLARLGLLAGATFFIGPDIMGRGLAARDGATARRSAVAAAAILAVFAALMALVGVWVNQNLPPAPGASPFASLIQTWLPAPVGVVLALGLISALVSSADTCLLSAAGILEHDLLGGRSLGRLRLFVALLGFLAFAVAAWRPDIIGLLLAAYSVYTPGVVIPLFFAIMFYKKRPLGRPAWYAAVVAGGALGLAGGALAMPSLPLWGLAAALVLSLVSLWR